jgi:hypothetical protein
MTTVPGYAYIALAFFTLFAVIGAVIWWVTRDVEEET